MSSTARRHLLQQAARLVRHSLPSLEHSPSFPTICAAAAGKQLPLPASPARFPWSTVSFGLAAAGLMTVAEAPVALAQPAGAAVATPNGTSVGEPTEVAKTYSVAFVLGGPGSGKGTQCAKMVEDFGVVHLSAGDLLRAHMKSGSADGKMVADMIANGQIVPSSVTIKLLQKAMADSGKDQFLIDGFPRNDENRAAFEDLTGIQPKVIFFFDCPEAVMEKRLLGRNEGRTDDNIETIRKRFAVFIGHSMPVVQHYEAQSKVARINADRDPEEVYKEVRRIYIEFMG